MQPMLDFNCINKAYGYLLSVGLLALLVSTNRVCESLTEWSERQIGSTFLSMFAE